MMELKINYQKKKQIVLKNYSSKSKVLRKLMKEKIEILCLLNQIQKKN